MENEQSNRAERRRQEREKGQQPPVDYGPVYPRTFDKCPVCGCPARFTVEALKDDLTPEKLKGSLPMLTSLEYKTETATHFIHLLTLFDSCVGCGAMYTIARDKIKKLKILRSPPGAGGRMIGRG